MPEKDSVVITCASCRQPMTLTEGMRVTVWLPAHGNGTLHKILRGNDPDDTSDMLAEVTFDNGNTRRLALAWVTPEVPSQV